MIHFVETILFLLCASGFVSATACKGYHGPQNETVRVANFDDLHIHTTPPANYSLLTWSGFRVRQHPYSINTTSNPHVIVAKNRISGNFSLTDSHGHNNAIVLKSFDLACYSTLGAVPGKFVKECTVGVTARGLYPGPRGFSVSTQNFHYTAPGGNRHSVDRQSRMQTFNVEGLRGNDFEIEIVNSRYNSIHLVLDNIEVEYLCGF